jgi:predicted enzyme related to lactoylglutathione lyase
MGRPVQFEIQACEPERMEAFYNAVFGWEFRRYGGYSLARTGDRDNRGIDGALMLRRGGVPSEIAANSVVLTVTVDLLDTALLRAQDWGGGVHQYPFRVPGTGWLAYVTDPEGNKIGLLQPSAEPVPSRGIGAPSFDSSGGSGYNSW